jgi:hypothetical protein
MIDWTRCIECCAAPPLPDHVLCAACGRIKCPDCLGRATFCGVGCDRCDEEERQIMIAEHEADIMADFGYRHLGGREYVRIEQQNWSGKQDDQT